MNVFDNDSNSGYSLIELLIVMFILGIVVGGIYMAFTSGEKEYGERQVVLGMQQQGRLALMNMEKDIKMIGYGFTDLGNLNLNTYEKESGALQTMPLIIGTSPVIGGKKKPDSLSFRYFDGPTEVKPEITLTSALTSSSQAITIDLSKVSEFNVGDFFIIYDTTDKNKPASLLRVTSKDATTGTINHEDSDDANPPGTVNIFPKTSDGYATDGYAIGCKVFHLGNGKLKSVRYYIDANSNLIKETQSDPSKPVTSHLVARGIEDLKISYYFSDGAWADLPNAGGHSIGSLRAVRISMLMRTEKQDPSYIASKVYKLSDSAGDHDSHSGGGFRRMIISSVICPRNLTFRE